MCLGLTACWRPYCGRSRSRSPPFLDGNGTITPLELQNVVSGVWGNGAPSKDQVEAIIKYIDVDDSGTIDFGEFLTLTSDPKSSKPAKGERRQAYNMFVKDGNGDINVAEPKEASRNLGEFLPNPSHRQISSSDPRFLLGQKLKR